MQGAPADAGLAEREAQALLEPIELFAGFPVDAGSKGAGHKGQEGYAIEMGKSRVEAGL